MVTRAEVLAAYAMSGAKLAPRSSSVVLRILDKLVPSMRRFYTTIKWVPFGRCHIYHPDGADPLEAWKVIWHELKHVEQWNKWYGFLMVPALYFLLPLPVLLSGRWYLERSAYLRDITQARLTIDQVVDLLWGYYVWPWPKSWMRRWFAKQLEAHNGL